MSALLAVKAIDAGRQSLPMYDITKVTAQLRCVCMPSKGAIQQSTSSQCVIMERCSSPSSWVAWGPPALQNCQYSLGLISDTHDCNCDGCTSCNARAQQMGNSMEPGVAQTSPDEHLASLPQCCFLLLLTSVLRYAVQPPAHVPVL